MLILTRKPGEALLIDGGVRVTLLGMDGRSARFGIEAPPDVRIMRAEIVHLVEAATIGALAGKHLAALARDATPR